MNYDNVTPEDLENMPLDDIFLTLVNHITKLEMKSKAIIQEPENVALNDVSEIGLMFFYYRKVIRMVFNKLINEGALTTEDTENLPTEFYDMMLEVDNTYRELEHCFRAEKILRRLD